MCNLALVTQNKAELGFKPRYTNSVCKISGKFQSSHLGTSLMGKPPTHETAHSVAK